MLTIFDLDGTLFSWRLTAAHDAPLDDTTIRPGVLSRLAELKAAGIPVGIATNQMTGEFRGRVYDLSTIQARLQQVSQFLDIPADMICFGSPDTTYWKPSPGMLLDFATRTGVAPANILYVGDADTDRQAAEAAGIGFAWAWDFFGWPGGEGDRAVDWAEWEREGRGIWREAR